MEGKHVFISILAALVAYAASAAVMLPIATHAGDFLRDVVAAQLTSQGAPQEAIDEAVKAVQPMAAILPYLIPVSVVLNSAIIGALFGMLYSFIIDRTGRRVLAALITGAAHAALIGAGLAALQVEGLMSVFTEYVPMPALLASAAVYAVALLIFSRGGPWEGFAEGRPSRY